MRPTLLDFRSPKEKTAELPQDPALTYTGHALSFQSKTMNKKASVLPQQRRFQQYDQFKGGSSVSSFVGPGTYNDHESFLKLKKMPCSAVIVIITDAIVY